jgi:hypothetical protein
LKKRKYSKDKPGESIKDTTIISDLTEEPHSGQSNEGPTYGYNIPPPGIVGTRTLQNTTNIIPNRGGRPKGSTIVVSQAKIEQR